LVVDFEDANEVPGFGKNREMLARGAAGDCTSESNPGQEGVLEVEIRNSISPSAKPEPMTRLAGLVPCLDALGRSRRPFGGFFFFVSEFSVHKEWRRRIFQTPNCLWESNGPGFSRRPSGVSRTDFRQQQDSWPDFPIVFR